MKRLAPLILLLLVLLGLPATISAQESTQALVVSQQGPYTTLSDALAAAQDGDVIEVHGGIHPGPITVEKSIQLVGIDSPVIDGGGMGTVISLTAPGSGISGFVIRDSGDSLDEENSGIAGEAPNLTIENNRLENTLFGIYLREAENSLVRQNHISSKDLPVPRRGDPIRVWFSNNVLIEGNQVENGRDVVLWYSEHLTVRENNISGGRYGLHFMYCDDATIQQNRLLNNSVGAFLMYSRRLNLVNNTIAFNRGPSGYGVGLKDMDDAQLTGNLFFDNRIGAHLDNSPREIDSLGLFEGNIFGFNDIGVSMMPSVRHNSFIQNSFIENQEQVSIAGGGSLKENYWNGEEQGNYWSDYAGYDERQDGLGDEPYRSERLFENLMDRYPALRLFIFSPSAQAVDFAARAVPLVKPKPKVTDEIPLMSPLLPENIPPLPEPQGYWLIGASSILLLIAGAILLFLKLPRRRYTTSSRKLLSGESSMVQVDGLTKRFGSLMAVNNLSFSVAPGEAVALWGPNGAGKTTVLRCLLDLIPFDGEIQLAGLDIKKKGKESRRQVGFVPQELNFHHDLTLEETMKFYARLKKVPEAPITGLLAQMNLEDHSQKLVAELSGGMKQRLALAISLLADPPILLLDEPTANLDVEGRDAFLDLLAANKSAGKTLIFSSHRLEEVMTLADRVLVMHRGSLTAECPPQQLYEHTGWKTLLYLYVPKESHSSAIHALSTRGFKAQPNGKRIWVEVNPEQKGEAISTVVKAGIQIQDFKVERLGEETENYD